MMHFIQRTAVAAYRVLIATLLVIGLIGSLPFPTPVIRAEAVPPPAGLAAEEWAGILRQMRQAEDHPTAGSPAPGQVKKLTASDGAADDSFGGSVAVSEETVVVGASGADVGGNHAQGAAYVFARNQGGADNWGQVKRLTASGGEARDSFGVSVAVSGETVVVGAYYFYAGVGSNNSQGAAYIFARNQGGADNWGQVKKLTASDGAAWDCFGVSVAVSEETVVVGESGGDSNKGAAYVFARNQGGADNWGQVKKLTASDGAAADYFGGSVAVSEETVVVGADSANVGDNGSQGASYVFARNQGGADQWGQVKKLTASDGAAGDWFGSSVAISGDTVVVGARAVDVGGNRDQGAAYVFARSQGGADNWGQVKKLTTSDGAAWDHFGYSVAVSGETVMVGAFGDDSFKGAAYVFVRNQGGADNWGQVKKLTASGGATGDWFGDSAISGETVVVGAHSADIGDNRDQGAAYVFARSQSGPGLCGGAAALSLVLLGLVWVRWRTWASPPIQAQQSGVPYAGRVVTILRKARPTSLPATRAGPTSGARSKS